MAGHSQPNTKAPASAAPARSARKKIKWESELSRMNPSPALAARLPDWLLPAVLPALLLGGCAQSTATPPRIDLTPAIQVLQRESSSRHASLRAVSMESVQQLHQPAAERLIAVGLKDSSPMVRFTAAMVAGRRRMVSLEPRLKALRVDPNASVRVAAIYALARLGDTARMNELAGMLDSADPVVRANVAMVLGRLGDRSAIPLLLTRANDPNAAVRLAVTSALARLGYHRAISSIIALSLSVYAQDHLAALSTCRSLQNPLAVNVLLAGLRDPLPAARLIAARGLGQRGSVLGESIATYYARGPDAHLRMLAALALGSIPVAGNTTRLAHMLDDANPRVRIAAAAGLIDLHHLATIAARLRTHNR